METKTFLNHSPSGFHTVAYYAFGDASREHVVCAHGLTRSGRDFDYLAEELCDEYRVICPDFPGRGESDWLHRDEDYNYPNYLNMMGSLIAHLNTPTMDWVGTSMGGLCGIILASRPNTPIKKLVVNDIGPFVPAEGLDRIGGYITDNPTFNSIHDLERYLRKIHAPFGQLSDEHWAHLAEHSSKKVAGEKYVLHYDPAIALPFRGDLPEIEMWSVWEKITCPVLIIRGEDSDLLNMETVDRMMASGPPSEYHEIPDCGHAPSLMTPDQIALIHNWLRE